MKNFRALARFSFLVGLVLVGVFCKPRKYHRAVNDTAVRELYDTNELEAYFPGETEQEDLLLKSEMPSEENPTTKVDNICTRRLIGDHMCPELF
eukprot:CAMPEP_0184741804 /NCGR_PEP_ID=MMETSP0315-20130426/4805_1 /TAXON_ID=101924 /ORGANISM="Rhodosorus marinus, Strain UTEX LB 2760" /LENGTH=93 /DNA_ID=CAMNT_0027212295 /DNA_START=136 /DNA_END=414 /DNA_ORIENTATION=-